MICNKYEMVGAISKEGFVRSLKGQSDGRLFIMKQFKKQDLDDPKREVYKIIYEKMKKRVNMPLGKHIYTYVDALTDNHNNYIIGPLGETINLRAYMDTRPNKVLELQEALEIGTGVLHGLQELHMSGRLHLNLKPTNILITPQKEVLLADQGIYLMKDDKLMTKMSSYLAPQINGRYSAKELNGGTVAADVWGFAVLLYYMLNGVLPFELKDDPENKQLKEMCDNFSYKKHAKMPNSNVDALEALFREMFEIDYAHRIGPHRIKLNKLFKPYTSNLQIEYSQKVYRDVKISTQTVQIQELPKEEVGFIDAIEPYQQRSNITIKSNEDEIEKAQILQRVQKPMHLPIESPEKPMLKKESKKEPIKIVNVSKKMEPREHQKQVLMQLKPMEQVTLQQPKPKELFVQPQNMNQRIPANEKPRTLRPIIKQPNPAGLSKMRTNSSKQHIEFKRHFERVKTLLFLTNFITQTQVFYHYERIALAYCMYKLSLFYCINFNKKCYSKYTGQTNDPNMNWPTYFGSKEFQDVLKNAEETLIEIRRKHSQLHRECADSKGFINQKIKDFDKIHRQDFNSDLEGDFKKCYRSLTTVMYDRVGHKIKELKHTQFDMNTLKKFVELKTALVLTHTINKAFGNEGIQIVFRVFLIWLSNQVGYEVKEVRAEELKQWLTEESVENLSKFCQESIKLFFN